jgi:hypothetical protein
MGRRFYLRKKCIELTSGPNEEELERFKEEIESGPMAKYIKSCQYPDPEYFEGIPGLNPEDEPNISFYGPDEKVPERRPVSEEEMIEMGNLISRAAGVPETKREE